MKANPLGSPLLRSLMTSATVTSPAWVNKLVSSSCVVDLDRFPTYNLASIFVTAFSGMITGIRNTVSRSCGRYNTELAKDRLEAGTFGWLNSPGSDLILLDRYLGFF